MTSSSVNINQRFNQLSEEQLCSLTEYSPVGILHANLNGSVTYANRKVGGITGMTAQQHADTVTVFTIQLPLAESN